MWLLVRRRDEGHLRLQVALRLSEGTLVVGRSAKADLVLNDAKVSARHLEITFDGEAVYFKDLDSRYGTVLNGEKAAEGRLGDDDSLQVGSSWISAAAELPRQSRQKRRTVHIGGLEAGGVGIEEFCAVIDRVRRFERPRKLLDSLLNELVAAVGAERGYVLIREGGKGRPVCVASHAIGDMDEFLSLSSTVYNKAFESASTVCIADSTSHPVSNEALSLSFYPSPRTIICCPLKDESDMAFGVVYLDMPTPGNGLHPAAVRLAETLTAIASERLSNRKIRYRLLAARERLSALQAIGWEDRRLVLGEGPAAKQLRETILVAARNDTTCLITGETGTGKEMVARALHYASARRNGPFIPVNCAAMPHDLIESELFGAEKGAYTGADERRLGRFELAQGGTLFLDEVGELPLDAQVKLLRVLQERKVTRIGGNEEIQLDFRLVCATNRDLEECVRSGLFRADLFYRINVFPIRLEPLRNQPEAVLPLAEFFLSTFSKRFRRNFNGFSREAERCLIDYDWPGNIRELRNAIERAVVIERGDEISAESLPMRRGTAPAAGEKALFIGDLPHEYNKAREFFERAFLERSLAANDGNIAAVVRETGLGRPTVYRWLKRFGIRGDED